MSLNPLAPAFVPSSPATINTNPPTPPVSKNLIINDDNNYSLLSLHQNGHLENLEIDAKDWPVYFDAFHTLPQLIELTISDSPLSHPPILFNNRQLQSLSIIFNQLESSPILSQNEQLKHLDLSINHLKIPPRLENNPLLETLNLSHNQLIDSPDVSWNPSLKRIDLSYNCLTCLHDSMLDLSSDCEIIVSNNNMTIDYISFFKEMLQNHRLAHPGKGPSFSFE